MNDTADEDRRVLQEMLGLTGPAFIRRGKLVETTWALLLNHCQQSRTEELAIVGFRLGQIRALAGSWDGLFGWLLGDDDRAFLERLHDELQPRLRLPLEATTSKRALRSAARDLVESMEMFNDRWTRWLNQLDLSTVNQARDDYNRYYLLEKECAVGSARLARIGFTKLPPVTLQQVAELFPLLRVPQFRF
jgi:hypothetical protein